METRKKWYQSETVWACVVVELCTIVGILAMFGVISAELSVKITTAIGMLAGGVGIHGRVNADTKIG